MSLALFPIDLKFCSVHESSSLLLCDKMIILAPKFYKNDFVIQRHQKQKKKNYNIKKKRKIEGSVSVIYLT